MLFVISRCGFGTCEVFANFVDWTFVDFESTKMYLDEINTLFNTNKPLKRINKYKLKFKSKPWITLGLQKSISVKKFTYKFQ